MPKRPPPRPQRKPGRTDARPKVRPAARPAGRAVALGLAELLLWLLVLVPPLVLVPTAKEPFRLPKLLLAEWLGLASLLPLCWELRRRAQVAWRELWRLPAPRAVVPALLVATLGLAATDHPLQVREALADLWIGAACLVGWSAGLPARRLERPLAALLLPGAALALLGILQFHGLYRPFQFFGVSEAERLGVTSLVGNPGELGSFLLFAALCGAWWLLRAATERRWRPLHWGGVAAVALCLYGLAVTQTLAALAALAAAGLVFAALALPPRRAVVLLGGGLLAAAILAAVLPPLRDRLGEKLNDVMAGDLNDVLTGRLDGWRAALWMTSRRPWTGVGHGAFAAEFVPAKEALLERGAAFYAHERRVFGNAHNDPLEVAATWGVPGLAALVWGLLVLAAAARRIRAPAPDRAFAWAGLAGLAALSLAHFPFRTALVGYPALVFFAWLLRRSAEAEGEVVDGGGRSVPGRALAALLGLAVLAAFVAQTDRARDRLLASRIVRQVELVTMAASRAGALTPRLVAANLAALRQAAALDPSEVGVPMARGGQYLLLRRPHEALAAYRQALALEPRPEIYLNLSRAYRLAGDAPRARQALERVRRLDPYLAAAPDPTAR